MSYTNQTQHYGLPQYVGTDVPAWLTDVNGAFATIDQGMNAAKTQADSAATAAGQAANDIVSINSTLGTQAGQISAAANAAAAAQTTANTADSKADTNTQSISGLDTRVTALEQSGGGGGLEYKDYALANGGASIPTEDYVGKTVVGALIINSSIDNVAALIRYSSTGYMVAVISITGAGVAFSQASGTVRVFFTPVTP